MKLATLMAQLGTRYMEAGMVEEVAIAAVDNHVAAAFLSSYTDGIQRLTDALSQEGAAEVLIGGFPWDLSTEGHMFWYRQWRELPCL